MSNKNKAIILIIISALTAALASTAIKEAGNLPFYEKSFFRNIITIVTTIFIILKSNDTFFGQTKNRKFLFFRALCGTLGVWCSYYAISHMLLANAVVLGKLSPFFVIIFSAIFLKEGVRKYHIIAMVIAFIGVIFVVKPTGEESLIVSLIAILSGLFGGAVGTFLRFLRKRENPNTIIFFYAFTSASMSIPFMIYKFTIPNLHEIIALILAGIFSSATQFALTIAYKYAPAKEISVFSYTNVIFITFIGMILWGNMPDEYSLIGYLLIIIGSVTIFICNNKFEKQYVDKDYKKKL
ncbi:MAG: DMT family transporter [Sarcina sp.]